MRRVNVCTSFSNILWLTVLVIAVLIVLGGCAAAKKNVTHPGTQDVLANNAYDVIATAKGYLDSERSQHPECATTPSVTVCARIQQAIGAKDLLIDALSAYCSGPNFLNGGACDAPDKATPAGQQAVTKLKAAIDSYNQTAADLKKATGGN